jgi:hypothetical protein
MQWSYLFAEGGGLCVAQLGQCDSERGATLGVVKARSNFRFCSGGDHVFDDGSDMTIDPFSVSFSGDLLPKKNRPPRRLRAIETEM